MTRNKRLPSINKIGGTATTSKGYNWVNDPFSTVLPYERHSGTFKKQEIVRKFSERSKGRCNNL